MVPRYLFDLLEANDLKGGKEVEIGRAVRLSKRIRENLYKTIDFRSQISRSDPANMHASMVKIEKCNRILMYAGMYSDNCYGPTDAMY